jgi:hypothetical protein
MKTLKRSSIPLAFSEKFLTNQHRTGVPRSGTLVRQYYRLDKHYVCPMGRDATTGHHRNMKRTVVWLTKQQVKALESMSKKSLAPVSALVRRAVDEFLRRRR